MSDWTAADLDRIGPDGSLRPYGPIWVVRAGGELFVRSWLGQASAWYQVFGSH